MANYEELYLKARTQVFTEQDGENTLSQGVQ